MNPGEVAIGCRNLEACPGQADGAVGAALAASDLDAEGGGECRGRGTVAPDIGTGEIAGQRRGVELAVRGAVIFLFDPGLGRL